MKKRTLLIIGLTLFAMLQESFAQDTLIFDNQVKIGKIIKEDKQNVYFKIGGEDGVTSKIPKAMITHYAYYEKPLFISNYPLNNTPNITKWDYCEIEYYEGFIFNGEVQLDQGGGDVTIKYKGSGDKMKFKSTVDALNYLGSLGWELISVYDNAKSGESKNIVYLFKRPRAE